MENLNLKKKNISFSSYLLSSSGYFNSASIDFPEFLPEFEKLHPELFRKYRMMEGGGDESIEILVILCAQLQDFFLFLEYFFFTKK
jgi:hypothetical protein